MFSLVLIISVLNLALGFGCAYLMAAPTIPGSELGSLDWGKLLSWLRRRPAANAPLIQAAPPATAEGLAGVSASDLIADITALGDELPLQWLEQLAGEGLEPRSLAEASAQVMRLEVGRYREQLITAENRARTHVAERSAKALETLARDLQHINQDWLDRQRTATELLGQRTRQSSVREAAAASLEQALLDQGESIGRTNGVLAALDYRTEAEQGGRQVIGAIGGLIDQAHLLRDHIQELIANLLTSEDRVATAASSMQFDRATGLANRVGLEVLWQEWQVAGRERTGTLSVALLDIDHFGRVNERFGTRAGDRTLSAFSHLLANVIRQDRGFDRIVRLGGETFLLFYGDTEIGHGLQAAERARQTLEATTWNDQGTEFDLTASCGVIGVGKHDLLPDVLQRAQAALRFAKQSGRNRVAVDEGEGPQTREPPEFALQGRVVQIEPES